MINNNRINEENPILPKVNKFDRIKEKMNVLFFN